MVYLGDKLINASDVDKFEWTMDTGSDASVSQRGMRLTCVLAAKTSSNPHLA